MTQDEALDILKMGHNVFLTGAAGSGKTYLLNQYISYLQYHKIKVGITASTGIAATHMGGVTIHSFVGMGIKDKMSVLEIAELTKKAYLQKRFQNLKVLIIDEISMLHASRLDLVDRICRAFKKVDLPFGGIQVVLCGDFFQLPPVSRLQNSESRIQNKETMSNDEEMLKRVQHDGGRIGSTNNQEMEEFAFQAKSWHEMRIKVCYLDEQYRQDDRSFLRVLNDIRRNEVSEMTTEYLAERLGKECVGYSKPTRLFTHNMDVDAINQTHLKKLEGESHEYVMNRRGSLALIESLQRSCLAPETLVLKIGAQVMFVKNNYEQQYVNGTLGEVIGFDKDDHPIVRTFDGNEIVVHAVSWEVKEENIEKAAIAQIPLRLAWAITVHKSQGMSLDAAEIDLSRSFLPGMGYVALSRVRSLKGLTLMGMNQVALQVHPHISEIDRRFLELSDENILLLQSMDDVKKKQLQQDFLEYVKGDA